LGAYAPLVREVLSESLIHAGTMVPVLLFVFLLMEVVSHGTKTGWVSRAVGHRIVGPVVAAALGLLPQCGFSVAATTLWVDGLIPTGSLLASYIATSDEAVPVLVSSPMTVQWVLPLLGAKLVWGTLVGIGVNAVTRRRQVAGRDDAPGSQQPPPQARARAGNCVGEDAGWTDYFLHAFSRTASVATMVFVLSSALGLAGHLAEPRLMGLMPASGLWQPLAASVLGLVPSCATSVALAEGFRSGFVSFPALLSGLTANAGLGVLVLVKESKDPRRTASVIAVLAVSALVAGCLASLFP
jgi:hypothetical protein